MRIDSHQHYWEIARGDYGWISKCSPRIYRDYMPPDLEPHLRVAAIDRTILVQAAPSVAETYFLLRISEECQTVGGVVGWMDFEAGDALDQIEEFASRTKLVGLRPMLQDIAATDWLLNLRYAPAFEAMAKYGLKFDALVQPRHLHVLATFQERYPDLNMVIDHGAKPAILTPEFSAWRTGMVELARNPKTNCKLSGLITEAGTEWSLETIKPYAEALLELFGSDRVMWGSDWPVVEVHSSYAEWLTVTDDLLKMLPAEGREAVMGGTAARFYGISE